MNQTKFDKVFQAYEDVFEEKFPLMQYQSATDEQIYDIMRECIAQNKDVNTLYPINKESKY